MMNPKINPTVIAKQSRLLGLFFVFLPLFLFTGCASVKDTAIEGAKGIAGISTEVLEDNRKGAIKKVFNYNADICYNESKRILKNMGCYIYAQEPRDKMIAVYVTELDTTPVGIFFKIVDDNNAQVEVSSPSTFGKEFVSKRLFMALAGLKDLDKGLKKGPDDAKEKLENK